MTTNDDKTKNPDPGPGSAAGTDPAAGTAGDAGTTLGFSELMGHVDAKIAEALRRVTGSGSASNAGGRKGSPEDLAAQMREELAKIADEDAAKQKATDQETTIRELQEQVKQIREAPPAREKNRLQKIMWGK